MTLVDRSAFLKATPRRFDTFDVPGVGAVRIQSITEKERHNFELSMLKDDGTIDRAKAGLAKAKLLTLCMVDADGLRILSDSDAPVIFSSMDAGLVDFIYERCKKHCNLEESIEKKSDSLPDSTGDGSQSG